MPLIGGWCRTEVAFCTFTMITDWEMILKETMKRLIVCFFCAALQVAYAQDTEFLQFQPGPDFHELKKVSSMALHPQGDMYLADESSGTVRVFAPSGTQKPALSSVDTDQGKVSLIQPRHICIDGRNTVYVYDAGHSAVFVIPEKGKGRMFGQKGGKIGQLGQVKGIAADNGGYVYILDGSRKQVDVYSRDGRFITWISGGLESFSDPVAIGVNGRDELHVLDGKESDVIVFDPNGLFVRRHRQLGARPGVSLRSPQALSVMNNGDFFILDGVSGVTTRFDFFGSVTGTVGSKGDGSRGTFVQAVLLASSQSDDWQLAVFDSAKGRAQVFRVQSQTAPQRAEVKRPVLVRASSSRMPAAAMATAKNGFRYVVNAADKTTLVAYRDSSSAHAFTLSGQFREIAALASDESSNVYVVDRKAGEVFVYDPKGILIRSFGREIPEKLKDPTGIAIQKNGTVLVADHGSGAIQAWNSQGVYQKIWVSAQTALWKSPFQIDVDSRDQVYVWDNSLNSVFRVGSTGYPVALKQLKARSFRPREYTGVIAGMLVDPFDQVHLFNATTGQLEVYSWELEPVLRFAQGMPGEGPDGFGSADGMAMDKETFRLFFPAAKGKQQSVWHFLVKPPTPEDAFTFDAAEDKLVVFFNKLDVPYVTAYGLLTTSRSGADSLALRTTFSSFTIDPADNGDIRLKRYRLVSLSQSNMSDPTGGFEDYYTYGVQLIAAERYDEALLAFQSALDRMGRADKLVKNISKHLTRTGKMLAQRGDVSRAMPYLRLAHSATPQDPETISAYRLGFAAHFQDMINREDLDGIVVEAERLIRSEYLRSIVLSSVDSVSLTLARFPSERSIDGAMQLQKKLVEWEPGNPDYTASLAATTFELYRFRKNVGASSLELDALLSEAERHITKAVAELKRQKLPVYQAELIHVGILNARKKHEDAEALAISQLSQSSVRLPEKVISDFRLALCESYKGRGRYDYASMEYGRMLEADRENTELKLLYADALTQNRNFDEARQIYQQLLLGDRDNADYTARIGMVELLRGNFVEASFQFEKAIARDPSEASFYGPLGEAFDGAGNYQKALENYRVAVAHQELRLDQVRRRMTANFETGQVQADLEKYLGRIARLHELLGNYGEAIRTYAQLIELNPSSAAAHYGFGVASMSAGQIYNAEKALAQASRLDPSNEVYLSAHSNALRQRPKLAADQPPLNILEVRVGDIFPSLYRNYADLSKLPVGEIAIANNTDGVITPTSITVFVKDLMSQPTQVNTPAIMGYSNSILKLNAIFDERILSFTEDRTMQIEVEVKYNAGGKVRSSSKSVGFLLRGRNAINWSDKRRLASFVSPSVDALMDFSRDLDAVYQEPPADDVNRPLVRALQFYTYLSQQRFVYTPDPVNSFATASTNSGILDHLQYPQETMVRKRGDCDDFVALFAALLENAGIPAAYVDVPGHVFVAFDAMISPSGMSEAGIAPRDAIVQNGKVWIPVETTLLGTQNFMVAWKSAADRYYRELQQGNFPEVVPLADARKVYVPSVYAPPSFSVTPVRDAALITEYNKVFSAMMARLKREVIRETEGRYHAEPGNLFVKNRYAILLAQTGDAERAQGVLLEALDLSPQNPSVLNNLGNLAYIAGKLADAIGYYLRAANADRKDSEIRINLCKAYLLAGDKTEARQWLDKAYELEPELRSSYDYLNTQVK
jgi:tetratricopeptide (TPR) repeat protein/DNA-binding beta-propeller fold protein YncE